jgi:threonine synthase
MYDYEAMKKSISRESIQKGPYSVWRYKDLLPVEDEPVDLNAGFTPLLRAKNLGKVLGLNNLYIKNDCANPTWSFKDRVVAVASSKAREFGFKVLACASTGNLANAVSAHAAAAGMEAFVFVPSDLEAGKLLGSKIYGANLVAVDTLTGCAPSLAASTRGHS